MNSLDMVGCSSRLPLGVNVKDRTVLYCGTLVHSLPVQGGLHLLTNHSTAQPPCSPAEDEGRRDGCMMNRFNVYQTSHHHNVHCLFSPHFSLPFFIFTPDSTHFLLLPTLQPPHPTAVSNLIHFPPMYSFILIMVDLWLHMCLYIARSRQMGPVCDSIWRL